MREVEKVPGKHHTPSATQLLHPGMLNWTAHRGVDNMAPSLGSLIRTASKDKAETTITLLCNSESYLSYHRFYTRL